MNRIHGKHDLKCGRSAVYSREEENIFVEYALTVSEWGYPFDVEDLAHLAQLYLNKLGRNVLQFGPSNKAGIEWANSFMKRHSEKLIYRVCQNLKTTKAALTSNSLSSYSRIH